MKIIGIYDKKGECFVHVSLQPSIEVAKREIILASRQTKDLVYASFPEDYLLIEIGVESHKTIEFSDFLKAGDSVGE